MSQPIQNSNLSGSLSYASVTRTPPAARTAAPPPPSSTSDTIMHVSDSTPRFRTFSGLTRASSSSSAFASLNNTSRSGRSGFSGTPRHSNPAFSGSSRHSHPAFSGTVPPSNILITSETLYPYIFTKTSEDEWDQPVFAYKGDKKRKISAAGILFYKKVGDEILLLVFHNQDFKKLEDLGGKTDVEDSSPLEAACREAEEETKTKILRSHSREILKSVEPVYIPESSYLLYIAPASEEIQSLEEEDFGTTEECCNKKGSWTLNRIIKWMPLNEFLHNSIGYKIHPRLSYILDRIASISA